MKPCWLHFWSLWRKEIQECPQGDLVVVACWTRTCRRCDTEEYEEVILSCASS